jgi:hypothetical protein
MIGLLQNADDILRRRAWTIQPSRAATALPRLAAAIVVFGMFYGAVMGLFGGMLGDRWLQVVYAALKVPFLLLGSFVIGLPSFFVLNTLLGLRSDFARALRAVTAAQAGLAVVLASLAPLTALWYGSSADYQAALRFNGLMFLVASLAGQWLLRQYYRPLILANPRHRWLLAMWLVIYVFVAIQLAWIFRPFVGDPSLPVQFIREESWGNAYVVVGRLIYDALTR